MSKRFGDESFMSTGPAPSEGDVAAAAADKAPVPEPGLRRKLEAKSRRRPAAAAAPATMDPVANQGLPGSGNTGMDLAAGQSLQEDADAWKQLPEVQQLLRRHREELDGVYETLTSKENELTELKEQTEANKRDFANIKALRDYNTKVTKDRDELSKKLRDIEDARQSGTDEHYNHEVLKLEVARLTSALSDAVHAKHGIEAEKDSLEGINEELNQAIDDLEDEAAHGRQVAIDNAGLKVEIMHVHRMLEEAFSDMAEDLTFKEKFAFIHEHQQRAADTLAAATAAAATAATTDGRSRIASGASLHDELENASEAGSEPAPKEEFSFSDITSVETVPVAAPITTKKPLELSTITTVDTAPVADTPAPKQPLSFSNISTVETSPVAASPPAKQPLGFSNISTVETSPVAASPPAKQPLGFSNISTVETSPVAVAPTPEKPFTFSNISTVDTSPVAPPVITSPKKAEEILGFSEVTTIETAPIDPPKVKPIIKWRTKNIFVDVDRPVPVTPWWMWLLFLIAIMTCAGASAALVREKNIWVDANELASLRLMGLQQESWIEWIGLGVGNLLASVGGGSAGLELFR